VEVEANRIPGKKEWKVTIDPPGGQVPDPAEPAHAKKEGTGSGEPAHGKKEGDTSAEAAHAKKEGDGSAEPAHGKKEGKGSAQTEKSKFTLELPPDKTVLAATLPKPAAAVGSGSEAGSNGKGRVTLLFVKLFE